MLIKMIYLFKLYVHVPIIVCYTANDYKKCVSMHGLDSEVPYIYLEFRQFSHVLFQSSIFTKKA
jgi:hypothetical protein